MTRYDACGGGDTSMGDESDIRSTTSNDGGTLHSRAQTVVVSSACRFTQAEVTPANRFVVTHASGRLAHVRFDGRHRVWHVVTPATAEVDDDGNDRREEESENWRPPASSDSHRGGGGGTGTHESPGEGRRDYEEGVVVDSMTCGSTGDTTTNNEVHRQEHEEATEPFSCEGTEGEEAAGTPKATPEEKPSAGDDDPDRVLDKRQSAAGSEKKEESCDPDGSSSAFQEDSVGVAQDDTCRGERGAVRGDRSSGGEGGLDGQAVEPAEGSVSPGGRGKQGAFQNLIEPHQPTAPVGTAETGWSTNSAKTAAVTREESGVATRVTWRGQPVASAGPIVIALRESTLRKLRVGGRRRRSRHQKSGAADTKRALAEEDSENDLPSSSDEGSDAMLAGTRGGRGHSGSAQHEVAQGRDRGGKRGGPSESGSSKRGSPAQRGSTTRCSSPPSDDSEAKEEHHEHADRKNNSSQRQCRKEESLPLPSDRIGSPAPLPPRKRHGRGPRRLPPRPKVFLLEFYAGPPVALCPRAWPAGTRVMADPTEARRRRNPRARRKKSSESLASRRARRKLRRPWGGTKRRSSQRTRLGSGSSSNGRGTTSSGGGNSSSSSSSSSTSSTSSSGSETFAREDKQGDGARAESKEYR